VLGRRQEPSRGRTLPLRLRARSEVKRRRNPLLRLLGDADQALLRLMRTRGHQPPVEEAMKALGAAGEWAVVWVALGAGAATADPPRRSRWIAASLVGPAAVGVNYAVKVAVGRRRPLIEGHPPLALAPSKLSFPSAHATSSLAAATALARVAPRARPSLYALAAGICLSRPYLGMHYPSDVLAGAALGLVLGRLAPGLGAPGAEDRLIDLVNTAHASARAAAGDGADGARAGSRPGRAAQ
jgi:membrane-associated phospholipid phosphatase